jgi:DNA-binding GntR family transcriptional regulator
VATDSSGNGIPPGRGDDLDGGSGAIVESLYRTLRESIVQCEIAPDAVISQVRLAQQLGVSRTPLREVLRLLEREGFVETQHNRQVRIAGFSLPDLEEVYATRIMLEPLAASVRASTMTAVDLDDLNKRFEDMQQSAERGNYASWTAAHRQFHEGLTLPSSQRINAILAQLADHSDRYRRIYATKGPLAWRDGLRQHSVVLEAVGQREPDRVSSALARHIAQTGLTLIAAVDPTYDAVLVRRALRVALADNGDAGQERVSLAARRPRSS